MKWTKLKSEVESRFCSELTGRVAINSTRYGNCTCGHTWVTLDKKVVANFCTRAFWNTKPTFDEDKGKFVSREPSEEQNAKYREQFVEYGELSRQDAYRACFEFIHTLSIKDALLSDDPLIQSLAVLDRRLGKRLVETIDSTALHPLARMFLEERKKAQQTSPANRHPFGTSVMLPADPGWQIEGP